MNQSTIWTCLVAFCLSLFAGCTTVHTVPQEPFANYPSTKKIALRVGLVRGPSILNAKWDDGMRSADFGSALMVNSQTMATHLFESASTIDGIQSNSKFDAYLTPRVTFVGSTHGMAFQDIVMTLKVEWSFNNAKGETIWLETVEGQGISKAGGGFGPGNFKVQFTERARLTLDNLFQKSFDSIAGSPEIRRFAATGR